MSQLRKTIGTTVVKRKEKKSSLLLSLLEDPDLVSAVGEFEGAVVARCVVGLVLVGSAVLLEALQELQQLLTLHLLIGEAPICPERGTCVHFRSEHVILEMK